MVTLVTDEPPPQPFQNMDHIARYSVYILTHKICMCNHTLTLSCHSQQALGDSQANPECFLSLATQGASVFHTAWTGNAWKTDGQRQHSSKNTTGMEQNHLKQQFVS